MSTIKTGKFGDNIYPPKVDLEYRYGWDFPTFTVYSETVFFDAEKAEDFRRRLLDLLAEVSA